MSGGINEYLMNCTDKDLAERLKVLIESANNIIHELDRRKFDVGINVVDVNDMFTINRATEINIRSITKSEVISLL
jgi:hypothetical protein